MEDFIACSAEVADRRQDKTRHNLHEILMIALCTMLCGGEDCSDMPLLGQAKKPLIRAWMADRAQPGPTSAVAPARWKLET